MQQNGALWLVKSSGRILGPFPIERIAELLRTREISLLDEVAQPLKRWLTIQYHDNFTEIVDSLRKASLSEHTETNWTPGGSNLTQTLTDFSDAELTEEITDSGLDSSFSSPVKEIVIHNVNEQQNFSSSVPGAGRYAPHGIQNLAIQTQVEKNTRRLWILTIVILALVGTAIVFKRISSGGIETKTSASGFRHNVMALIRAGHYREALQDLRGFYPDPLQSGDLAIYYGALLISVDQQTVPGRRVLKWVSETRPQEDKQAYTGMGLADLFDSQWVGAKANLEKALHLDPDYVPALVNLAFLYLSQGDLIRAKSMALSALKKNERSGEAMLALAEAQTKLFKTDKMRTDFASVKKSIEQFQNSNWHYAPQLNLYSIYAEHLLNGKPSVEKITQFLDRDPRLALDHIQFYLFYSGRFSWSNLARYCEEIVRLSGSTGASWMAFLAACHSYEGRWDLARREIEQAVNQEPKDPLIQAWYSHILNQSGESTQASVVLARANDLNRSGRYLLPVLLQARFCQEKEDVQCARRYWKSIYERNMSHLPAIGGLAWVYSREGAYGEALLHIDRGLQISSDYIPLLSLRMQAEGEGWNVSR